MIRDAILSAAQRHGLNPALVYGVCLQESGLNPFAVRYEPHYRWLVRDRRLKPPACSDVTEQALQRMSLGLMQVMGAVIREQGFSGWLTEMIGDAPEEVALQLESGCRHLAKLIRRWGVEAGIAAYNAGSPRLVGGRLENQGYVDNVLNKAKGW